MRRKFPPHRESLKHLARLPKFGALIKKHGPPDLDRYFGSMQIFSALTRSIIYQQISGKAAASIFARFRALFPKDDPTPARLAKLPDEKLRAAGLSPQKISYLQDLAHKYLDGTVDDSAFETLSSEEIIAHLIRVKGIGVWTAQMLLIFTLKRPDVLPTGDLAIQKGFQKMYNLPGLPKHAEMEELAKDWRAHASIASWYLWRISDDLKSPAKPKTAPLRARKLPRPRSRKA